MISTPTAPKPRSSARYAPRGAARALMSCRAPEVLISGPAGTGKSRACLEKVHLCLLKYPGARALMVRKTRESLTESALVTFEEKVLPHGSAIARGPMRRLRQSYRYGNGSELVVGGLDKSNKVMSTEYDIIYVQEAIELHEDDWESLTTRLRNGVMPYQQLVADTNPDAPHHWLKQRCDVGRTVALESRHEDNPGLWDGSGWTEAGATYIGRLDALSGPRKPRLRFGRWVQAEGVVYEQWDRRVHLIDRFPIPPDWRRIRSLDWGYTNPFSCLWVAIDPDGRMYLYREIYMTSRTVAVHCATIKQVERWELPGPDGRPIPNPDRERIEASVADTDAGDRATAAALGIPTVAAIKDVSRGIQAVQERLKSAGDGKPRLFVMRDSLIDRDPARAEARRPCCAAEEFDAYVWAKAPDGRPSKEEPLKLDDHAMDALRYAVMYNDYRVTWRTW